MIFIKRVSRLYLILGKTFKIWLPTIFIALGIIVLRVFLGFVRIIENLIYAPIREPLNSPIIIVGNPRSGTTFLHRFMIKQHIGTGSQLWQMLYPSIIVQKLLKPFLPILEKISPAKYHSTEAHKTSLTGFETDDVSLLFRYVDGFFLYGFFLTFDEEDLFHLVDPNIRDTTTRDYNWFDSMWRRNVFFNNSTRYIGKLFSLSSNLPSFQRRFPEARVLYLIRDPLSVIPSGLSLVTGVLDKRFNFWSLDKKVKERFIKRLYNALVQLLLRFKTDWNNGSIDKDRVMIVHFDLMMNDFESLMEKILNFIGSENNEEMQVAIRETAALQREYKSNHKYDLHKFGLTKEQIKNDCSEIYKTFLR